MRKRGRPPSQDVLTPAEWKVVEGVRHGLTNPGIACRQGVSVDAVKYHLANALQKLHMRSRRELRQWDGVSKASALPQPGSSMSTDQALNSVGQIGRTVRDIHQAIAFFRDVMQIPHLYSFGNLAFFDCDGVRLMLSQEDETANDSIIYFRVRNIHMAADQLKERGVAFINAPHMIHKHGNGIEEWMAFFKDQDGRPLALMAQTSPSSE